MSLYIAVRQMGSLLKNLETWLDDAVEHAKLREYEPDVLLGMRLSPDMQPLVFQIRQACDHAKLAAARLAGREPPKHPDTETTLAEIRARLASVREYLATFEEKDFVGAEERLLQGRFVPEGKRVRGVHYFYEYAQPNFYFHATTTYALLRHAGVKLGKRRFIQSVQLEDA